MLIYIHKEKELDDVERRFPADHYVLIDDKILFSPKSKKTGAAKSQLFFPNKATTRSILKLLPLILRRTSRWSESAS